MPIFKKGAKSDPANYRPVSLTSVCCKLLESLIKDKLMQHLEDNNSIFPSQHGFMPGRSCTTNLLEFFEYVTAAVDEGDPVDIIFLDFAKAFDKVPRDPLVSKLKALGVGGQVLDWISNWLTGREQRVVLNGQALPWAVVDSGFPQGSILGPVLFVIHINDIDLVLYLIDIVKKFADDTKMGQKVATPEQRQVLQDALDSLVTWANDWGMQFNVSKCKVMHLGNSNPKHVYKMTGVPLAVTTEEKDVGVLVSSNLKPSAQCAKAAKTAALVLGQIARAFHFRDRNIFVNLYKQYVRPHLEFACPAWSPWTETDKETLEKVQKRAIKMVSGLSGSSYEDRLAELGMVTLAERRHQTDMVQVFKIVNGFDRVEAGTWFNHVNPGNIITRSAADPLNIAKPRGRLDLRLNFFSLRVVDGWNNIPADIKRARSVPAFKKAYRNLRLSDTQSS